jgi:hypothetical protein
VDQPAGQANSAVSFVKALFIDLMRISLPDRQLRPLKQLTRYENFLEVFQLPKHSK